MKGQSFIRCLASCLCVVAEAILTHPSIITLIPHSLKQFVVLGLIDVPMISSYHITTIAMVLCLMLFASLVLPMASALDIVDAHLSRRTTDDFKLDYELVAAGVPGQTSFRWDITSGNLREETTDSLCLCAQKCSYDDFASRNCEGIYFNADTGNCVFLHNLDNIIARLVPEVTQSTSYSFRVRDSPLQSPEALLKDCTYVETSTTTTSRSTVAEQISPVDDGSLVPVPPTGFVLNHIGDLGISGIANTPQQFAPQITTLVGVSNTNSVEECAQRCIAKETSPSDACQRHLTSELCTSASKSCLFDKTVGVSGACRPVQCADFDDNPLACAFDNTAQSLSCTYNIDSGACLNPTEVSSSTACRLLSGSECGSSEDCEPPSEDIGFSCQCELGNAGICTSVYASPQVACEGFRYNIDDGKCLLFSSVARSSAQTQMLSSSAQPTLSYSRAQLYPVAYASFNCSAFSDAHGLCGEARYCTKDTACADCSRCLQSPRTSFNGLCPSKCLVGERAQWPPVNYLDQDLDMAVAVGKPAEMVSNMCNLKSIMVTSNLPGVEYISGSDNMLKEMDLTLSHLADRISNEYGQSNGVRVESAFAAGDNASLYRDGRALRLNWVNETGSQTLADLGGLALMAGFDYVQFVPSVDGSEGSGDSGNEKDVLEVAVIQPKCSTPHDIFLLLDTSASVGPAHLESIKSYGRQVASQFHIGPASDSLATRVMLIPFPTHTDSADSFLESESAVMSEIDGIEFVHGRSNLSAALDLILNRGIQALRPSTEGIYRKLVLITDKTIQLSSDDLSNIKQLQQDDDVEPFVIRVDIGSQQAPLTDAQQNLDDTFEVVWDVPSTINTLGVSSTRIPNPLSSFLVSLCATAGELEDNKGSAYHYRIDIGTTLTDVGLDQCDSRIIVPDDECRNLDFYLVRFNANVGQFQLSVGNDLLSDVVSQGDEISIIVANTDDKDFRLTVLSASDGFGLFDLNFVGHPLGSDVMSVELKATDSLQQGGVAATLPHDLVALFEGTTVAVLSGNEDNAFSFDFDSGDISILNPVDFFKSNVYSFELQIGDCQRFTVHLTLLSTSTTSSSTSTTTSSITRTTVTRTSFTRTTTTILSTTSSTTEFTTETSTASTQTSTTQTSETVTTVTSITSSTSTTTSSVTTSTTSQTSSELLSSKESTSSTITTSTSTSSSSSTTKATTESSTTATSITTSTTETPVIAIQPTAEAAEGDDNTLSTAVPIAVAGALIICLLLICLVRRNQKQKRKDSVSLMETGGFSKQSSMKSTIYNPNYEPTVDEMLLMESFAVDASLGARAVSVDPFSVSKDFMTLDTNAATPDELPKLPESELVSLNRYRNILPNNHSRVQLSMMNGNLASTYINANFVRGFDKSPNWYIVTQGPKPETSYDFWRMVWEQNVRSIIMVTGLQEGGRTKCAQYWPQEDKSGKGSVDYEEYTISIAGIERKGDFRITTLKLTNNHPDIDDVGRVRTLKHYWYDSWPDHGAPTQTNGLTSMIQECRKDNVGGALSPWIVHCSAGIGRSGTVVGMDMGMHQLETKGTTNIRSLIYEMREDRGGMVQTDVQAAFLYRALQDYASYFNNKNGLLTKEQLEDAEELPLVAHQVEMKSMAVSLPPSGNLPAVNIRLKDVGNGVRVHMHGSDDVVGTGTLRYIGEHATDLELGVCAGIEFDEAVGHMNGTEAGHKYFQCPDNMGALVDVRNIVFDPPRDIDLEIMRLRTLRGQTAAGPNETAVDDVSEYGSTESIVGLFEANEALLEASNDWDSSSFVKGDPIWLHEPKSQEETEALLRQAGSRDGNFLVRRRYDPGTFSLSTTLMGKVTHHEIVVEDNGEQYALVIKGNWLEQPAPECVTINEFIRKLADPENSLWPKQLLAFVPKDHVVGGEPPHVAPYRFINKAGCGKQKPPSSTSSEQQPSSEAQGEKPSAEVHLERGTVQVWTGISRDESEQYIIKDGVAEGKWLVRTTISPNIFDLVVLHSGAISHHLIEADDAGHLILDRHRKSISTHLDDLLFALCNAPESFDWPVALKYKNQVTVLAYNIGDQVSAPYSGDGNYYDGIIVDMLVADESIGSNSLARVSYVGHFSEFDDLVPINQLRESNGTENPFFYLVGSGGSELRDTKDRERLLKLHQAWTANELKFEIDPDDLANANGSLGLELENQGHGNFVSKATGLAGEVQCQNGNIRKGLRLVRINNQNVLDADQVKCSQVLQSEVQLIHKEYLKATKTKKVKAEIPKALIAQHGGKLGVRVVNLENGRGNFITLVRGASAEVPTIKSGYKIAKVNAVNTLSMPKDELMRVLAAATEAHPEASTVSLELIDDPQGYGIVVDSSPENQSPKEVVITQEEKTARGGKLGIGIVEKKPFGNFISKSGQDSKLQPGQIIISINGEDAREWDKPKVVKALSKEGDLKLVVQSQAALFAKLDKETKQAGKKLILCFRIDTDNYRHHVEVIEGGNQHPSSDAAKKKKKAKKKKADETKGDSATGSSSSDGGGSQKQKRDKKTTSSPKAKMVTIKASDIAANGGKIGIQFRLTEGIGHVIIGVSGAAVANGELKVGHLIEAVNGQKVHDKTKAELIGLFQGHSKAGTDIQLQVSFAPNNTNDPQTQQPQPQPQQEEQQQQRQPAASAPAKTVAGSAGGDQNKGKKKKSPSSSADREQKKKKSSKISSKKGNAGKTGAAATKSPAAVRTVAIAQKAIQQAGGKIGISFLNAGVGNFIQSVSGVAADAKLPSGVRLVAVNGVDVRASPKPEVVKLLKEPKDLKIDIMEDPHGFKKHLELKQQAKANKAAKTAPPK